PPAAPAPRPRSCSPRRGRRSSWSACCWSSPRSAAATAWRPWPCTRCWWP
ncbi:MAG: hypothetical protein AVDCRST_MAG66-3158, partial [uncultured Pseudonocardia sp.]